jgi:nucleoid-associated protein YgaU
VLIVKGMGSVERVLVLGIVVVIVAILGIAVWGASDTENGDNTPAQDGGAVVLETGAPIEPMDNGLPSSITPPSETAVDGTMSEIEALQRMREAARQPKDVAAANQQKPGGSALSDGGSAPTPGSLQSEKLGVPLKSSVPVSGAASEPAPSTGGPVVLDPAANAASLYTVGTGDSLWKIAHKQYGSGNVQKQIDAILAANPSLNAKSVLKVGQKITLPAAMPVDPARMPAEKQAAATGDVTYTVKAGDTLSTIAKKELGSTKRWNEIWDLNRTRLPDPAKIVVGMKLTLPKKN